eukprot:m51a1_g2283 putative C-tail anchored protein (1298) ;mRNA; r:389989-394502
MSDPRAAAVAQTYGGSSDCQILVHIIEARDLKGRDSSGQSDPVVVVTALGQKRSTKIIKKTTSCTWDHLMDFQFRESQEAFMRGTVRIDVFDANTMRRDVLIGSYTFDVASVYAEPSHEFYRRWTALADLTDAHEGVQGYLKVSVVCLRPGDVPRVHAPEDEEDDDAASGDDLQGLILRPPSISVEEWELVFDVHRAAGLPAMDVNGKCDPYVVLSFAGQTVRTEHKNKTLAPEWNERLHVPVTLPSMSDAAELRVYDKDAVGSDELIATLSFSFAQLRASPMQPAWVHLYGPTKDGDSHDTKDVYEAMARGTVEGCAYRGSLLLAARAEKVAEGKLHKTAIGAPAAEPASAAHVVRVDAVEASGLPTNDDVWIEASVGLASVSSKKADVHKGRAVFGEAMPELVCQQGPAGAPDLFIGVYRSHQLKHQRVAYARVDLATLGREAGAPEWFSLLPDVFNVGDDKDGGFALLRVSYLSQADARAAPRQALAPQRSRRYRLRAHVYQARDLPAADQSGLSDPYVSVRIANQKAKTAVEKETLFPSWFQTVELEVDLPEDLHYAPSVTCVVKDDDTVGADTLCRCVVPAASIPREAGAPTWIPLWDPTPETLQGALLAAFQLFPVEDAPRYPCPHLIPKISDMTFEGAIINVERLLPRYMLPPRAPYAVVTVGSGKSAVQVQTRPAKSSSSKKAFSILELVKLPVQASDDPLFAPPLNVVIKDDRPGVDPVMGTLSLSLGKFYAAPSKAPGSPVSTASDVVIDVADIEDLRDPSAQLAEERSREPALQPAGNSNAAAVLSSDSSAPPAAGGSETQVLIDKHEDAPGVSDAQIRSIQERRTLPSVVESVLEGVGLEAAAGSDGEQDEEKKRKHVDRELETQFRSPFREFALLRGKKTKGSKHRKAECVSGVLEAEFRLAPRDSGLAPVVDIDAIKGEKKVVVRLYVLRGRVVPKDNNGLCDPFVQVVNGPGRSVKIRDEQHRREKTLEPEFYSVYEVPCLLPAQNEVTVSVWDWDRMGADDFIGLTKIDVGRRYASQGWRDMGALKPVENRTLWNPTSSTPQGHLEMWVDIMTEEEAARVPALHIGPPPPMNFELRVTVWNTSEVKFRDKTMSDIFLVGYTHHSNPQKTDIHWRSEDGTGMFNWRFVFPVTLPSKIGPHLTLQVWDKDLLNPNDIIAEAKVNLRALCRRAYAERRSVSLPRQWVSLLHPNYDGPQGKVELTVDLLTEDEALRNPAGKGRDPPNALPEPNRPKTSFAAWRVDQYFNHFVWKRFRIPIIIGFILLVLVLLAIAAIVIKMFVPF